MKTRKYGKIMTLFLALAMIMAMSISSFAASGSGSDLGEDNSINPNDTGIISNGGVREDGADAGGADAGKYGVYQAVGNKVTLYKDIVIFNTRTDNTDVYLPNIKYEYTVSAVTAAENKYITDEYGLKGSINSGVPAAAPSGKASVEYNNTTATGIKQEGTGDAVVKVTTNTNGVAARGSFDLTFDPSKFTKPGIFRYKVTESLASGFSRPTAGVTNDTYNADRYLDVYVQNKTGGGYEIYGFVLFEATDKDTEFTADPGTAITAKTNGFVSNKYDKQGTTYSKTEKGVDIYETSNVKISKTITGAMADKNNKFPFKATIANTAITKDPIISFKVVGDNGSLTTTGDNPTATMTGGTATIGSATATVAQGMELNDADYVYIYGVPGKNQATNVVAEEYNNTTEVYKVSAKYDNTDLTVVASTTGTVADMNAAATAKNQTAQNLDITKAEDELAVTNNLAAISPTNVVMRYAPYLFILGGAIMLLVISRRRKAEQE